jgi:hypothetical protein
MDSILVVEGLVAIGGSTISFGGLGAAGVASLAVGLFSGLGLGGAELGLFVTDSGLGWAVGGGEKADSVTGFGAAVRVTSMSGLGLGKGLGR